MENRHIPALLFFSESCLTPTPTFLIEYVFFLIYKDPNQSVCSICLPRLQLSLPQLYLSQNHQMLLTQYPALLGASFRQLLIITGAPCTAEFEKGPLSCHLILIEGTVTGLRWWVKKVGDGLKKSGCSLKQVTYICVGCSSGFIVTHAVDLALSPLAYVT